MIALVFSYEVATPTEFERVYGPTASGRSSSGTGRGYIGTELLHDVELPSRYLVIDRWESAEAYNAFVAAHREEYMQPGRRHALPLRQELRFGTFETLCDGGCHRSRIA